MQNILNSIATEQCGLHGFPLSVSSFAPIAQALPPLALRLSKVMQRFFVASLDGIARD
ncbi:MAG: hypothetical protein GJU76_12800 [Gallionella sp.]|jgi:hypothetical protein|nr:hypothetical protein [Gallionella sp.]